MRNVRVIARERQRGQGLVEYALILVLVMLALVIIVALMGNQLNNMFSMVASEVIAISP